MAFLVIAEPADAFEQWLAREREAAPLPAMPWRNVAETCSSADRVRCVTRWPALQPADASDPS